LKLKLKLKPEFVRIAEGLVKAHFDGHIPTVLIKAWRPHLTNPIRAADNCLRWWRLSWWLSGFAVVYCFWPGGPLATGFAAICFGSVLSIAFSVRQTAEAEFLSFRRHLSVFCDLVGPAVVAEVSENGTAAFREDVNRGLFRLAMSWRDVFELCSRFPAYMEHQQATICAYRRFTDAFASAELFGLNDHKAEDYFRPRGEVEGEKKADEPQPTFQDPMDAALDAHDAS